MARSLVFSAPSIHPGMGLARSETAIAAGIDNGGMAAACAADPGRLNQEKAAFQAGFSSAKRVLERRGHLRVDDHVTIQHSGPVISENFLHEAPQNGSR